MTKTLLLAALAGALTACTITINGSGSEGNTAGQNTSGGPGSGTTEEEPSATTIDEVPTTGSPTTASTSTAEVPTTDPSSGEPSTGEPVLTGSETSGTGDSSGTGDTTGTGEPSGSESDGSSTVDTDTTTGGSYGMCGWNAGKTYYACPTDDGVPGLEDPKNNYPIDCRDQELVGGAPCGQVGPAGCCTPTGDLYYCGDNEMLVEEHCGA